MLEKYLIVLPSLFCFCFTIWLWYLRTQLASVIDVGWSLGILLAGSIFLLSSNMTYRHSLILILLFLWSVRLAGYLYTSRIKLQLKDRRYENLSSEWKNKKFAFLAHYLFQGLLMSFIAIPFYFIGTQSHTTPQITDYIAISLFIIAFVFESLADWQLTKHKKSQHTVCQTGLWKYSRHPNYFFEALIWVAFALFALSANYGYFAIISPITITFIVTILTGPMTERASLKSRGQEYKDYIKTTAYFIPWFKKKS